MWIHSRQYFVVRKGVTSLLEIVICVVIFAMLLMMLIGTMSHMGMWTAKSADAIEKERDTDFLLETLVKDVKSADDIACQDDSILLFKDGDMTNYHIEDNTRYGSRLYRDNECIFGGIQQYSFTNSSSSVIRVYVLFNDGQEIDIAIRR